MRWEWMVFKSLVWCFLACLHYNCAWREDLNGLLPFMTSFNFHINYPLFIYLNTFTPIYYIIQTKAIMDQAGLYTQLGKAFSFLKTLLLLLYLQSRWKILKKRRLQEAKNSINYKNKNHLSKIEKLMVIVLKPCFIHKQWEKKLGKI